MESTQQTGMLARIDRSGETAISALASKAKAEVEARYVIALQRPRNIMEARRKILDACQRPAFAEGARYRKPMGGGRTVDGLSIRFAETAIQAFGNTSVETTTIWDDQEKRTVRISVTDLEANISHAKDVTISKTVERREVKPGQVVISERINSTGQKVFLVAATEDDLANKIAAAESKVIRNCGLRLIPQDILEEAEQAILETQERGGSDPLAETKKLCDGFAKINVKPAELEKYLKHPLDTVSKKELIDLRAIYAAIRDGETSWSEVVGSEGGGKRPEIDPADRGHVAAAAAKAIDVAAKVTKAPANDAAPVVTPTR
jgi:hypothetical protein